MEILREHVDNLRFLLEGVPKRDVSRVLKGHALAWSRWRMGDVDESAYPALQTADGREKYAEVKKEMWEAVEEGNYIEIDNNQADKLCSVCGNLIESGCRLKGRPIKRR
jgi:hypothetical protein